MLLASRAVLLALCLGHHRASSLDREVAVSVIIVPFSRQVFLLFKSQEAN